MKIRVGLIGMGRCGRAHLERLVSSPEVEIAAICDSDRERAEGAAERCGATVHLNFRTMIEAERLDAVFVCLPPFARGEPEILAARAGVHLFIQQPVATGVEKVRQIQKEIENAGVLASVGYSWRYMSGTETIREMLKGRKIALVQGGQFGPVPEGEWRRRRESSGGRFLQEASDIIDVARYVVGDIIGVCATQFEGIVAPRVAGYDVEDALAAVLTFRSGAVGSVVSSDVAPDEVTSLSVIADGIECRLTTSEIHVREKGRNFTVNHTGDALQSAQAAFLDAVKSGDAKSIRSPYADAVRTLEVSVAAVESARLGKYVGL